MRFNVVFMNQVLFLTLNINDDLFKSSSGNPLFSQTTTLFSTTLRVAKSYFLTLHSSSLIPTQNVCKSVSSAKVYKNKPEPILIFDICLPKLNFPIVHTSCFQSQRKSPFKKHIQIITIVAVIPRLQRTIYIKHQFFLTALSQRFQTKIVLFVNPMP